MELLSVSLRAAGMTSPLDVRAWKRGPRSGRNGTVLQHLDRELIGPCDGLGLEPAELCLEGRQVLDRAVDGGEHHGRDAVQSGEPAEGELADPLGVGLAAVAAHGVADRVGDLVEPLGLDRALAGRGRSLESAQQLVAVEPLAPAVTLDDVHAQRVNPLVGREALAARLALAAPADRVSGVAGVDDAVAGRSAVGTLHLPLILQPLVVLLG